MFYKLYTFTKSAAISSLSSMDQLINTFGARSSRTFVPPRRIAIPEQETRNNKKPSLKRTLSRKLFLRVTMQRWKSLAVSVFISHLIVSVSGESLIEILSVLISLLLMINKSVGRWFVNDIKGGLYMQGLS